MSPMQPCQSARLDDAADASPVAAALGALSHVLGRHSLMLPGRAQGTRDEKIPTGKNNYFHEATGGGFD